MGSQPIPVGDELRRAREAAGLEISDVAAHLRIRSNFLVALEEGRPDALPGVTYAIGYVRTYSGFLGLDPDNAVRRFKEEAAGLNSKPELIFPSPAPEGRVPGVAVMLIALVLAGSAYGGWYWLSERDGSLHDLVPLVPERLAQLIEGDAPSLPAPAAQTAAEPARTPAPRGTVATYADANPTGATLTSPPAPTAAPATVSTPAPRTAPANALPAPTRPEYGAAVTVKPTPAPEATVTAAKPPAVGTPTVASPSVATPAATPNVTAPLATSPAVPASQPALEPVPTDTDTSTAEDTPDVTDLPEPAGTVQAETTVPATEPTAPTQRLAGADLDVPAAPRIAGLIGTSEAAVPASRTTPGTIDRIMIRATGDSWVQVRDAEGTALFTRVLRDGDIYRVPSKVGLKLVTGNAGALDILVDGNPAPSIGGFGEVVRNIALDPARLAAGTAATVTR